MYPAIGAAPNLNLNLNIQATVGPSLLQGLNSIPQQPPMALGFPGAPNVFNPGGLGSLRPMTACGAGGGSRADGYIQGLEDALKQVRGPKSRPDEERIRALLQAARQNRQNTPGPACQRNSAHQVSAFCGPQGISTFQSGYSAGPQSQPQGTWQQGYAEGIEAALQQIRGKNSKPDEKRVRALLQGARQAQGAGPRQQPGNYLQQPLSPLMPQGFPGVPSLFSGCRSGLTNLF